jgi:hypothetical protein
VFVTGVLRLRLEGTDEEIRLFDWYNANLAAHAQVRITTSGSYLFVLIL